MGLGLGAAKSLSNKYSYKMLVLSNVTLNAETEKAVNISVDGKDIEETGDDMVITKKWFPKKSIFIMPDHTTIHAPRWLINKHLERKPYESNAKQGE